MGECLCGSCPNGFLTALTRDSAGRLNGSSCSLPVLEVTTGAGAQAVVEPGPMVIELDILARLNSADLAAQMRRDIVAELDVSPEGASVSIQPVGGRRRQLEENRASIADVRVEAIVEMLVPGSEASALMSDLTTQLLDPSSDLITALSNSSGLPLGPQFFTQGSGC
eukprot:SAG11_NODE_458_length_9290_cov_2.641388_10_plen_167_part_00